MPAWRGQMVVPSSASPPGEPRWIRTRPPDVAPSLHRSIAPSLHRITATSSRLRATPSQCLASVLRLLWGRHLTGSLRIETTGSRRAIETPGPGARHLHAGHRLGRLQGTPPGLLPTVSTPSFSMSCAGSRRVTGGSLAFVFLIHTCRVMLDVSPTLTTATLHDSRWGWCEAGS